MCSSKYLCILKYSKTFQYPQNPAQNIQHKHLQKHPIPPEHWNLPAQIHSEPPNTFGPGSDSDSQNLVHGKPFRTWHSCKNPRQTHSKPGSPKKSKPPKRSPAKICTALMASRKWDLQLQLFGANQFSLTQIFLACKRFKEERQNLCLESNMQRRKGVRWDSSAGAHKHSQPGQYQGLRQANKWSLQTSCGQQSTPTQEHQTNKRATCSCLHA